MGYRNHAFNVRVFDSAPFQDDRPWRIKKAATTQRDNKPKPSVPTRDSEERERLEDRQYDKRNEHPLNEDPDVPAQPRR